MFFHKATTFFLTEISNKKRQICSVSVLTILLSGVSAKSIYAVGPGDLIGKKETVVSTESADNSVKDDYVGWYGCTNQDGSDVM